MTASGPEKLLYLTLGILFLVLGFVGLIVPVLPGVLFLAGAVYMLARGSRRARRIADEHPALSRVRERMEQFDAVSLAGKVQVTALMMLQGVVVGVRKVVLGVGRLFA